jgi:ribonuclease Z
MKMKIIFINFGFLFYVAIYIPDSSPKIRFSFHWKHKVKLGRSGKESSPLFELVFLGTSASAPSARRNLPALMVIHDEFRFLVDCGEGTQRQILQAGVGFKRLNRILITHGHLDHILGLAGLLSTYMRWEAIEMLEIYGGKSALERIRDLLFGVVLRGGKPDMPVKLIPVSEGPFFEWDDFKISAFPVEHRGPDCYGYVFEEAGRRPFLSEKAEALGIPPGPWRKELVAGNPAVLPDGRKIKPEQVLGEYRSGVRLVIIGDAGETKGLEKYCSNADALVIEGTYLDQEREMADKFSHLTVKQAAEMAKSAGVHQLFISHVSRRYRDKQILKEANAIFPTAILPKDLDSYQVKREE